MDNDAQIGIRVPRDMKEKLDALVAQKKESGELPMSGACSHLMRSLIRDFLNQHAA